MQCGICEKPFSSKRKATCPSCARATLYHGRIEQAEALLNREKSHTLVEAVVRPGNDGVLAALPEDADWSAIETGIQTNSFERAKAEMELAEERIRNVTEQASRLKQQIEDYKAFAEKQKESIERRRKHLASQKSQSDKHSARALESVQVAIKKTGHRLDKVRKRTSEAREHLCREVSTLAGLKKVKREDGKSEYRLNHLLLPDLRDLNGINGKIKSESVETISGMKALAEPHEIVSAALDSTCRVLGICCHYLSIRLPSEIILPHNDFPHAIILPRDASYKTSNLRYPGSLASQSLSPATSRVLQRTETARPRLLQLDWPLPQLQKEDPKSALLFLEGVVFLAYNIAWLCRSQGVDSINTFTEICSTGSNLYHLFSGKDIKARPRPVLNRNISTATDVTKRSAASTSDSKPQFGTHSHASAGHSLTGHEGFAIFNHDAWAVSITRLSDQLKSYLRQETARAEWHIVDDTEWDEGLEDERPVLIGGARRSADTKADPAMSVLSVKPSDGTDEADFAVPVRENKGWMKVRGRGGEG